MGQKVPLLVTERVLCTRVRGFSDSLLLSILGNSLATNFAATYVNRSLPPTLSVGQQPEFILKLRDRRNCVELYLPRSLGKDTSRLPTLKPRV